MANLLSDAISPYLRSHADNPVDWHGWGAEAFVEARLRDLPVLVSIGYSTCHWCHVMARESFSDPELADYLNEHFVSIKVDREEHPEVDASYLAAASAFAGGLGWPLNVFVTPEGQAFYAGTYFPPSPLPGHPSFRQVLEAVTDAWTTRRAEVTESASLVAVALAAAPLQGPPARVAGGRGPGRPPSFPPRRASCRVPRTSPGWRRRSRRRKTRALAVSAVRPSSRSRRFSVFCSVAPRHSGRYPGRSSGRNSGRSPLSHPGPRSRCAP
ncbi:MAG: thioredoxin domain-containing protein [Ramlibacter sp.]|nr:thioredoxin domain-containing protein [Cryobacterium sp.]